MMKITGLSHLFKWENLHNWWLTKYFFAPLYIYNSDYKRVLLKENPFPFHAVSNGTTWKRNVTRPEKENDFFTQER